MSGIYDVLLQAAPRHLSDMLMDEGDGYFERDEQECWCPDTFLEAGFYVRYCPQHGCDPDPELWTIPWRFPESAG